MDKLEKLDKLNERLRLLHESQTRYYPFIPISTEQLTEAQIDQFLELGSEHPAGQHPGEIKLGWV